MEEPQAILLVTEMMEGLSTIVSSTTHDSDNKMLEKLSIQVEALGVAIGSMQNAISERCKKACRNTTGKCMGWSKSDSNEPLNMCMECDRSAYYKGGRQ